MVNQEYYKIGQKIRNFRKRAGLSQLQLETQIGMSPGGLSRIENGEVSPMKETIVKIIEILDLNAVESAALFDLDQDELPKLIKLAKSLSSNLSLDELLQKAVNEIAFELKLLGVVICLIEGSSIHAKTFTQSWYTRLVLNIIEIPFNSLNISLDNIEFQKGKMYEAIKTKRPIISNFLKDFSSPPLSAKLADLSQKVSGHKCAICFPLLFEGECVGTVLFTKGYIDDFKVEMPVLEAFSEHIATAVVNARKHEVLENEITLLKTKLKQS
jgi:transcriptional regulator with XRE-family HTH domain